MDNSSGVGVLDKAALVLTALEAGPATQTLDVDLPAAGGTFSYVCTIHAQMEGDLFVDAAPSG